MAAEKNKCLIALRIFIKRLQHHLQLSRRLHALNICEESVADDVKEGHFTVLAKNNDEEEKPVRFVVELCVLKNPAFLRLLKLAEEEYGFQHRGALRVPCPPEELRRILQDEIF